MSLIWSSLVCSPDPVSSKSFHEIEWTGCGIALCFTEVSLQTFPFSHNQVKFLRKCFQYNTAHEAKWKEKMKIKWTLRDHNLELNLEDWSITTHWRFFVLDVVLATQLDPVHTWTSHILLVSHIWKLVTLPRSRSPLSTHKWDHIHAEARLLHH